MPKYFIERCFWDSENKTSVWRYNLQNPTNPSDKLASYRFDSKGNFLSFLRTGSSITDSLQFQEFRYNNEGQLVYNYNFDRTKDRGWAPDLYQYEYDSLGFLASEWFSSLQSSGGDEIYDLPYYSHYKYSYDSIGWLNETNVFSGRRMDSLVLRKRTRFERDSELRLIAKKEFFQSDYDTVRITYGWFYFYSTTGLLDSTITIHYASNSWGKDYHSYNAYNKIEATTHLEFNATTGDTTIARSKYHWVISDNEQSVIVFTMKGESWEPWGYNRQRVDNFGRVTLKEFWILDNWVFLSVDDQTKREEFEWDQTGLLIGYKLYRDYPDTYTTPDLQYTFFWSEQASSAVESLPAQGVLQVFPNPAQDQVTLDLPGPNPDFLVRIFSPSGTLIKSIRVSEPSYNLDLSGLSEGIYWIDAVNAKTRFTTKLIKLNP